VIGNFIWSKKTYTIGGKTGKNKPSEPKTQIRPHNHYGMIFIDQKEHVLYIFALNM
jgi:hypothetical protein